MRVSLREGECKEYGKKSERWREGGRERDVERESEKEREYVCLCM